MKTNPEWWSRGEAPAEDACAAFLSRHSAYRDGELDAATAAAHEGHAAGCASCAQYARVLERGVQVLRGLGPVVPSDDFDARLQHRLFHVDDEVRAPRRRYLPVGAMAAAVAGLLLMPRLGDDGSAELSLELHPHEAVFGTSAQLWQPAPLPIAEAARHPAVMPIALYSPVVVRAPQYYGGGVTFAD